MNKNNLIMYALLGGAAFWAYRRFGDSAIEDVSGFIDDIIAPTGPSLPGEPAKTPISSNGVSKPVLTQSGSINNTNPTAVKPVGVPDATKPTNTNAVSKPVGGSSVTPPISTTPPRSATDNALYTKLMAANGGRQTATADVWNYHYGQITGTAQSADLFESGRRDSEISIGTYFARRSAAGLSGGLVRSGVGGIFDRSIALRNYNHYNRGAY